MKASRILFLLLFLVSCSTTRFEQDWKIFKHPKGWNRVDPTPFQLGRWPEIFQVQIMFDSTCKYVFYKSDGTINPNQFDYNKAGGWSFQTGDARINSCLVGWRWGLVSKKIELTFYNHINKLAVHQSDPVLLANFYQVITFTVIPNYETGEIFETLEVGGVTAENSFQMPRILEKKDRDGRESNFYFGGQERAPHTMYMFKRRIK